MLVQGEDLRKRVFCCDSYDGQHMSQRKCQENGFSGVQLKKKFRRSKPPVPLESTGLSPLNESSGPKTVYFTEIFGYSKREENPGEGALSLEGNLFQYNY